MSKERSPAVLHVLVELRCISVVPPLSLSLRQTHTHTHTHTHRHRHTHTKSMAVIVRAVFSAGTPFFSTTALALHARVNCSQALGTQSPQSPQAGLYQGSI